MFGIIPEHRGHDNWLSKAKITAHLNFRRTLKNTDHVKINRNVFSVTVICRLPILL